MTGEVPQLVGDDARLPLPWLAGPLADATANARGHALLVHAPPGIGAMAFVLTLAQAWLCEAPIETTTGTDTDTGTGTGTKSSGCSPCGRCGSCRLVQAHLHPDLQVVMPETLRRAHRWPLADDKPEGSDKRKPSRQIRVDDVRGLIDWSTRTTARGRGKVGVLHPAEVMNPIAASALLKTLEEPPPGTRLLLTCSDPLTLLPTVRSRCQRVRLATPANDVAAAWLQQQGVAEPQMLLAACSGRPLEALELSLDGVDAAAWAALPRAMAGGHATALAGWPVTRVLDALQKLCHDALARTAGGSARFFPQAQVPADAAAASLLAWERELQRVVRHAEHPWNEGLLIDALVRDAANALAEASTSTDVSVGASPTLRR